MLTIFLNFSLSFLLYKSSRIKKVNLNFNEITSEVLAEATTSTYEYIAPNVGLEIWTGSIVSLIPIIWATIEFSSRIKTQQQCLVCQGSGLVYETKTGNKLSRARKCWSCGGFLPWIGWKAFFLASFDVGNGGVLQRPSKNYQQNNEKIKNKEILNDGENESKI
jgi:hypothetical protein